MKSQIITLLSLVILGSAAVFSAQTPVVMPASGMQTDRDAEIPSLRQELKVISNHLEYLEAEGHQPAASGYNFDAPVDRVNLLRAYDVTSNSFNRIRLTP